MIYHDQNRFCSETIRIIQQLQINQSNSPHQHTKVSMNEKKSVNVGKTFNLYLQSFMIRAFSKLGIKRICTNFVKDI